MSYKKQDYVFSCLKCLKTNKKLQKSTEQALNGMWLWMFPSPDANRMKVDSIRENSLALKREVFFLEERMPLLFHIVMKESNIRTIRWEQREFRGGETIKKELEILTCISELGDRLNCWFLSQSVQQSGKGFAASIWEEETQCCYFARDRKSVV